MSGDDLTDEERGAVVNLIRGTLVATRYLRAEYNVSLRAVLAKVNPASVPRPTPTRSLRSVRLKARDRGL
jgi:hypothetical protein